MGRSRLIWMLAALAAFGGCKRTAEPTAATPAPATPLAAAVDGGAPADGAGTETLRALTAVLEPALAAYNAGDQPALYAHFAATATPPADGRIFTELYEGYYKTDFGRIVALRLHEPETVADPEFGMLVYLAQCERVKLARVSANFVRENGIPKIVQLRFERVDTTAK